MRERLFGALGLGRRKPPEAAPEKTDSYIIDPSSKKIPDLHIEIRTSLYLLSKEAQKYLAGIVVSDYEKTRSVLMVNEPHYNIEEQFNLYKFLETFFRDNPTLIPKTTFLAEGFPANQAISVKPLIEVEPNPDEELIRDVLSSFLITGYMAYEWKYQKNIPIVGTEDERLYQLSSRLWPSLTEEIAPLWNLTVVARNQSMARILMERTRMYENPMLFIGSLHLERVESNGLQEAEKLISTSLSKEEAECLRNFENLGLHDYLKKEKIGYKFFFSHSEDSLTSARSQNTYKRLFQAQQSGDYREYIEWLISERGYRVTTRPSPEAAAEFVRAYRKAPSAKPEARAAYKRGLSLMAEGKYAEAAEEFSAASAADPRVTGYLFSIQESGLKEVKSRITGVRRKGLDKPDLPIYGPYQEKDHYQRVSQFDKIFARIPGKQEVIDNAMHWHWKIRYGGILQIKGAQQLGPKNIRAFEERQHLKLKGLKGGERVDRVDIATKDDIAIECKNIAPPKPVATWQIHRWIKQAERRFEPDIRGYKYKAVIIVVPDNKDAKEIETVSNQYIKSSRPELLGKIKVCRVSQLKETYSLIRGK